MTERGARSSGPAGVLARVAELLDLSPAREQILRAVATHPRPNSIVAIVDVATQLGLTVTPVRSTIEGLRDQAMPIIVHFENGDQTGFGVIEAIEDSSVTLWDGTDGSILVDSADFESLFSGVAVLIDPPPARKARKSTWSKLLSGPSQTPSLTEGSLKTATRATLSLLLMGLALAGLWKVPGSYRIEVAALALLAVAGAGVAAFMTVAISGYQGPFSPGLCRAGRFVDCQSVLNSRFSRIFGFPMSELGVSFYLAVLMVIATGRGSPESIAVASWAFLSTTVAAVILIGVQIHLRRFCLLCMTAHALNGVGWIFALRALPDGLDFQEVIHPVMTFVVIFGLVLFVGIPHFKQAQSLSRISSTQGRMVASPFASLALLATEETTDIEPTDLAAPLGTDQGGTSLVAFLHPSCGQCGSVLRELTRIARADPISAYISVPPRSSAERPLCAAILAAGLSSGPDMLVRAYETASKHLPEFAGTDPFSALAALLEIEPGVLHAARADATLRAERSQAFAARHVEGTPTVFFNGRAFRGPMSHLITLLNEHASLLPPPTSSETTK